MERTRWNVTFDDLSEFAIKGLATFKIGLINADDL